MISTCNLLSFFCPYTGLDFMMMEDVYSDKFVLHEESLYDPDEKEKNKELPTDPTTLKYDPRFDMQLTWIKFFKVCGEKHKTQIEINSEINTNFA